ncbi:MAG: LPP20 family lipoprotein [Candidatus Krumholzibacteriota bacterium]|nr:LPP20 family lipoprotein [Candidatus Krumholzibacteriota bacterium]
MKNVISVLMCFAILFVGCGSEAPDKSTMGKDSGDLPDWVLNPKQVDSEKTIYGVGIVSGVKNKALAIKTAENRAISSIARVFRVEVEAMMEDYASSTLSGDLNSSEEQDITNVQRTLIDQSLSGVVVENRFVDEDGSVYVRAKLDFETFEKNLEKLNTIDLKMKEYVKSNAEEAFGRLDVQIEKGD